MECSAMSWFTWSGKTNMWMPLYEMDKKRPAFPAKTGKGMEGLPFLDGQLVKAGQMLGNIWLTAWLEAPEDTYLEKQLQQRNAAASANQN